MRVAARARDRLARLLGATPPTAPVPGVDGRDFAGPRLLAALAGAQESVFFVEVGANDGEQHDHLRPFILEYRWRGIMVEPVPYVFDRLRQNYAAAPWVILENVAVGRSEGSLPFYHLAAVADRTAEGLPQWYDGIGSFSREAVLGHVQHIPDIASRVVSTEVPVVTLETLCRRHEVDNVDVVVIDVEGFDAEILESIDLASVRPQLLVYEHFHLPAPARAASLDLVAAAGYRAMEEGFDTWCLREDANPALRATWDRVSPAVPGLSEFDKPA